MEQKKVTKIIVDNIFAITLAKSLVFHKRGKHINFLYHFIQEQVTEKKIKVSHLKMRDQVANIFTQDLQIDAFQKLKSLFRTIDRREFGLRSSVSN